MNLSRLNGMLAIITIIISFISCKHSEKDFSEFHWLEGNYVDSAKNFYENWQIIGDTMLIGKGYWVNEPDTGFYESLSIVKSEEDWCYNVENNGNFTSFRLINVPGDSLVFENQENIFPKRITYLKKDSGVIHAIIDNPEEPEKQITFILIPQK